MAKLAKLANIVGKDLRAANFTQDQVDTVTDAIHQANVEPGTYNTAVVFLGLITIALAVGSVVLAALQRDVAEGLWGALGAGIGGLAGIFMAGE